MLADEWWELVTAVPLAQVGGQNDFVSFILAGSSIRHRRGTRNRTSRGIGVRYHTSPVQRIPSLP